jgi:PAS domain S-box-containing protein
MLSRISVYTVVFWGDVWKYHKGLPGPAPQIRVVIADDDDQLRSAIADSIGAVPDMELVGSAADAESVIRMAGELRPDVVLMDVRMPGSGARATREVLAVAPATRVVALSAYEDQSSVLEMLKAGAIGYQVKGSPEAEILEAVRRAARGQLSLTSDLGGALVRDLLQEIEDRRLSEASLRMRVTAEATKADVAIRDVSSRRQTEAVPSKSKERFRGLLESAPDALIVIDGSGRIQLVNARTEELFAYRREELLGQSIDVLVPHRLRNAHPEHRASYLAAPSIRPMGAGIELCGRRQDGSEFPIEVNLSPFNTDQGTLVVASVRDVSERKLDERQLARSVELAERQRAFSQLVRAQEEERLRIASDIHDDTIQTMTAASLRLQQLRRRLTVPRDLELLAKLEVAVQESIVRLRRLMFDLRPPALDRSGLGPALRDLLDRLEEETGVMCVLRNEMPTEPPPDARISLYRITQQALTNVSKHAHAKRVDIELSRHQAGSLVKVGDDGVGFEGGEKAALPGHLGLVMMRERARMAGGWLKLASAPGRGTSVEFWVPDIRAVEVAWGMNGDA